MQTHGPVVVDAFHRKYLLHRSRDKAEATSGEKLIQMMGMRQEAVAESPHRIERRDELVCDLIRLNGTFYEDLREMRALGADDQAMQQGMALLKTITDLAFDELEIMPSLFLGDTATRRR
ncbi:hypothetical protein LXM50_09500 [Microbacterium sp. Au-Mic1]|uniref:hypothetical protein n=1 Tax=Microbacterium sp. Au-Mic1 TaxID=2906457 RepID=UPI001E30A42F|nr:hypothetical protein [Microbacterium sp. Au-Mic1]MCE4026209.1 hypothetical protein [Microbacterium sp. Au-Mic1]